MGWLCQVRLQRRGGRERIVALDGSKIVPASKPQPDDTLVKALARAYLHGRTASPGLRWLLAALLA
jgi:hypothetical protein